MSTQSNPAAGKISVRSVYHGLCCPWDGDPSRWNNKRKRPRNAKRKTLRTHRTGTKR
jgi:hypothetical protein